MCIDMLKESYGAIEVLGSDFQVFDLNQDTEKPQIWPALLDVGVLADSGKREFRSLSTNPLTWRFRPGITLIVQDEMARVVDIHRGQFYALDLTGTRMLFETLKTGSEAMVHTVAAEYRVPEPQVRQDWTALVEEFNRAGLTQPVRVSASRYRLPGRWAVWLRLTLAWMSFWLLGWERTLRLWRPRASATTPSVLDDHEPVLDAVDRLVRHAASRHPLNPQCKERALVAWHILRRLGIPARLVMGVSLYPFEAHAWAEIGGRVVGDAPERCKLFTPVATYE